MRRVLGFVSVCAMMLGCGSQEPMLQGTGGHEEGHHEEGHHAEGHHAEGQPEAAADDGPAPTRVLADGARLYGAEIQDGAITPLADIVASPQQFAGQVVRTEGTIERVCQRMGCWIELRAESTPAVRVPMAGHAFFLPRDVVGRTARIEGRVELQELSPDARAHLESEGAIATASTLSIDATGVIVR